MAFVVMNRKRIPASVVAVATLALAASGGRAQTFPGNPIELNVAV